MQPKWPRLSETLTGPKHPGTCQSCGNAGEDRWRECGDRDEFTPIIVVLCKPCTDLLIEPHPRLYHTLQKHEPCPGTHDLCVPCIHRDGLICRMDRAHGGPGVALQAKAMTAIVGRGNIQRIWPNDPTGCSKLQLDPNEA